MECQPFGPMFSQGHFQLQMFMVLSEWKSADRTMLLNAWKTCFEVNTSGVNRAKNKQCILVKQTLDQPGLSVRLLKISHPV